MNNYVHLKILFLLEKRIQKNIFIIQNVSLLRVLMDYQTEFSQIYFKVQVANIVYSRT
jgi:hypothetical protein